MTGAQVVLPVAPAAAGPQVSTDEGWAGHGTPALPSCLSSVLSPSPPQTDEGIGWPQLKPAVLSPPAFLACLPLHALQGGREERGCLSFYPAAIGRRSTWPLDIYPGKREEHGVRRVVQFCVQR